MIAHRLIHEIVVSEKKAVDETPYQLSALNFLVQMPTVELFDFKSADLASCSVVNRTTTFRLISLLPGTLTSPSLTSEWENNLTLIAKGKAEPTAFMGGIEGMLKSLVSTAEVNSDVVFETTSSFSSIGSCPRCKKDVREGKANYYCSNKDCNFTMWRNDKFFIERKIEFTSSVAKKLLGKGKASIKGIYSVKTGKTYDATVVLADTGVKYVNYKIEL